MSSEHGNRPGDGSRGVFRMVRLAFRGCRPDGSHGPPGRETPARRWTGGRQGKTVRGTA